MRAMFTQWHAVQHTNLILRVVGMTATTAMMREKIAMYKKRVVVFNYHHPHKGNYRYPSKQTIRFFSLHSGCKGTTKNPNVQIMRDFFDNKKKEHSLGSAPFFAKDAML